MLFAVCYGIGCCAFLALIALVMLNRKPAGFGLQFLVVCILTAAWAAAASIQSWWLPGIAHWLESVQSAAWLILIASLLRKGRTQDGLDVPSRWPFIIAVSIGSLSVANDLRYALSTVSPVEFSSSQILERVIVAVAGILLVENLVRNTPANRKWHVLPLCIAAGGLFAFNLFVFSEVVVLHGISTTLLVGRGVVLALMVPFLLLTMARNPDWRIEAHVSRKVVFHTATLMAAGIFLLAAAGVAALIGQFPGEWAAVSEIAFFCASIGVLATVLSTGRIRSRLRRLISENFFSTRYDYRLEWLRCITTLSAPIGNEALAVRSIRAIADVVDSPGGALWLEGVDGSFRIEQVVNLALDRHAVEPSASDFIEEFQNGTVVQEFDRSGSITSGKAPLPPWANEKSPVWLAVPLARSSQVFGFVVLAPPRAPMTLNWESFDLLLAIGQQVAGFLSEERATRSLLETQALIDYSRKFAFVVHDVKNVAGQLGMMAANIRQFGDSPEFQADLIRGMEGGIQKLQSLLDRLRPQAGKSDLETTANAVDLIERVARELGHGKVSVQPQLATKEANLEISPADLHSILTHLVTNAIEASQEGGTVLLRLLSENGRAHIDIVDTGCGMDEEFVRNELFVPFRTTKARGHGVGAYQARELLRAAAGDLEVTSEPGCGTTVRVILPARVSELRPARELTFAK